MALDMRVSLGFINNPKTRRLSMRLGHHHAVASLIMLWSYCGIERPDGDLSGMSDEDIDIVAGLVGFSEAARSCGFIDGKNGNAIVHDWQKHQPLISGKKSEVRVAAGKKGAEARWSKRDQEPKAIAMLSNANSSDGKNSPTPTPTPTPTSKKKKNKNRPTDVWHDDIEAVKSLWLEAAELNGQKWNFGGAIDDVLARQFDRDGGAGNSIAAMKHLMNNRPMSFYVEKGLWNLAWLCRTTDSSKNPVNRMVDIVEGRMTEKRKPSESKRCPECCRIDCICDRIKEQHNVPDEELPF